MNRLQANLKSLTLSDWLAFALLLLYVVVFSTLTIRQHQSFNTNALDLAKFDQSIWNTAHGRPYQISIGEDLVLESHFSPSLAIFAPIYWIWPDIRALFIAQSLLLGGAGFLIYWFFRSTNPWMGMVVFGAFLMQPALHQVNLIEFRRLTLAVFATSFAVYHLLRKQYGWMAVGLGLALLSKEDMSLTAIAFGLYILVVQREWKIGALTLAIGTAWFILVPFTLLPAIMTHDQSEGYQHAVSYYDYLGESLPEIVRTAITSPGLFLEFAGRTDRLQAVFNLFWPTAFLFLLAPEIAFFLIPHLGFLLTSTSDAMGTLQGWYPSILIILMFWAVAVGISRLEGNWRKFALGILLAASFGAWISSSQLWPGKKFDLSRYQISPHDQQVAKILDDIPEYAVVMAQDAMVPHLSHRQEIHLFPWNRQDTPPEYIVLDREMRPYPLRNDEYRSAFYDVLAGTEYALLRQQDSFYLFEFVGEDKPDNVLDEIWDDSLHLYGYSLAAALPGQEFSPLPEEIPAGTILRVTLYWDVQAEMGQNYTVFVHALNLQGQVVGQHDSWPADTHRPTSVLNTGEKVRDVHYLTVGEPINREELSLRIGLYEAIGGKTIFASQDQPFIQFQIPVE